MAKQESSREDLLRDGKNFLFRGEVALHACKVVVGFRDLNQCSIYCGEDPVFQFNADAKLRRVFFQGVVYRAAVGELMQMRRSSKGGRVLFDSSQAPNDVMTQIQFSLGEWLANLRVALGEAEWRVIGESREEFLRRLEVFLSRVSAPVSIAHAPNLN